MLGAEEAADAKLWWEEAELASPSLIGSRTPGG